MKKYLICQVAVFVIAITSTVVFAADQKDNSAIVKNELLLKSGPGNYMEVRHIVLKGSNEEIGRALGDIARKEYNTSLVKYPSPLYAKARLEYAKANYPILEERMKGVARAYGLSLDNTDQDTTSLYYWMTGPKCSAFFIPAALSASGRNIYSSNRDYYLASMSEIMDRKRQPGEVDFSSRVFVLELYPDKGYSSVAIGAFDMLNLNVDAVNSKGLAVAVLQDDTYGMERAQKDLSRQSGLTVYQLVRLIVDTCATLDEAKESILNNKVSLSPIPAHFIVMDSLGKSFIWEKSSKDGSDRFTSGDGNEPVPITNHSISDYPAIDKFPEPVKDDYDTFNRYRRLKNYMDSHSGKYSAEDANYAMSLVYGRVQEASEGGYHAIPLRTQYTAVVDIDERAIWAKFYLRDGKADPATGQPELIFSEPFEFKLEGK